MTAEEKIELMELHWEDLKNEIERKKSDIKHRLKNQGSWPYLEGQYEAYIEVQKMITKIEKGESITG